MPVSQFSIVRPVTVSDTGSAFTRASIATYIGKDGLLKLAGVNEPRFQYDATGTPQGLLYETTAATNLLKGSTLLTNAVWTSVGTPWTVAADALAGPNGLPLTDGQVIKCTAGATPNTLFLRQTLLAATTAQQYAQSIWIYVPSQGGITGWSFVGDLSDTDNGTPSAEQTAFGQWVRVQAPVLATGARTVIDFNIRTNGGNTPPTGFIFYAYGPQFETGSVMSSYMPNSNVGGTATRLAEALNGMVSNVGERYGVLNLNPEDLNTSTSWTVGNLVVAANPNGVVAPLATFTSAPDALCADTVSTNAHKLVQDFAINTSQQVVCISGYFAPASHTAVLLSLRTPSESAGCDITVDLNTGNIGGVSSFGGAILVGIKVDPILNGFYRIQLAGLLSTASVRLAVYTYNNITNANARTAYVGDNAQGLYAWGVMANYGPHALPYATAQTLTVSGGQDAYAWSGTTTYAVGAQVSRVVSGTTHAIYQKLTNSAASTTPPENDTTNWVYVAATNKFKMFDLANETQTISPDDIQVALKYGQSVDTVMFENLDADSVRVFVNNSTQNYDKTIATKTRACSNWYQFFFEPFTFRKTAVFTGLSLVTTNLTNIIVRKAASVAKAGTCLQGLSRSIGYTEPGAGVGIIDYSTKTTDQFGSTTVTKRPYSKRMNASIIIENADLDSVQDTLATLRATPVGWLGAGGAYGAMTIYGYYRSFDIVIAYPTQSRCNLEIEGLT